MFSDTLIIAGLICLIVGLLTWFGAWCWSTLHSGDTPSGDQIDRW